jgi:hypothetical protein
MTVINIFIVRLWRYRAMSICLEFSPSAEELEFRVSGLSGSGSPAVNYEQG